MLCVPIVGPTLEHIQLQVAYAVTVADVIEFRWDLFDPNCMQAFKTIQAHITCPYIFTVRSVDQKGAFEGSLEQRCLFLYTLCELYSPTYMDLEFPQATSWIPIFTKAFPHIKLIVSYHDFNATPCNLQLLLQSMQAYPAQLYKIACMAHSILDCICMLKLLPNPSLIVISMGRKGILTRVLAPLMGAAFGIAALDQQHARYGQIDIQTLRAWYHHQNPCLYGLLIEDGSSSISDHIHNYVMQQLNINALYLVCEVTALELPIFLQQAYAIGFRGFSVTIPYKETILSYLNQIDSKAHAMKAVNTIVWDQGWKGYNTDGQAAIAALSKQRVLKNSRVVVIGAGGVARAIIYTLLMEQAQLFVINRTIAKANAIIDEFKHLGDIRLYQDHPYDILINATSIATLLPVVASTCVMEVALQPTSFIEKALQQGCDVIYGYEMFCKQAAFQYTLWFGLTQAKTKQVLDTMEQAYAAFRYCRSTAALTTTS